MTKDSIHPLLHEKKERANYVFEGHGLPHPSTFRLTVAAFKKQVFVSFWLAVGGKPHPVRESKSHVKRVI